MYSMAVSARLTLQLARKDPDQVTQDEIAEAENFLKAVVATLKPIYEGKRTSIRKWASRRIWQMISEIVPSTGPQRDRYAGHGNGRARGSAGDPKVQPGISHRLTATRSASRNISRTGRAKDACTPKRTAKPISTIRTVPGGTTRREDGLMLGGADDVGHFSHSMHGVMLVHDATPELGADDDFMTAVANAVYHNSIPRMDPFNAPRPTRLSPSVARSGIRIQQIASICSKPSGRA
jgi:hypothetical protein